MKIQDTVASRVRTAFAARRARFEPGRPGRARRLRRMRPPPGCHPAHAPQRGFTLIEVSIVTAIVLLIAVIGIPAIAGYVMENKVPKVGQELARFVMHTRVNAGTSGEAPYENISSANLAAMVADSTVLTLAGDGTVLHGLGGAGAVEVEPVAAGSGFRLRLTQVNHVACPSIASVLQRVADVITVSAGGGATTTLKNASTAYNALAAEAACRKGDVNEFVFNVA